MPDYRLYHLDPRTGHIARAEDVFAADDAAAIDGLRQRRSPHPLELWQEGRKVTKLDGLSETAARTSELD